MSDWSIQSHYLLMLMQISVTLIVIPLLSYSKLSKIALEYGVKRYPKSEKAVKQCLKSARKRYWTAVLLIFCIALSIVVHALTNKIELFNWDDQSGLMLLYLLAMIPVIVMALMHKRLFTVFKQYTGSKRSASLQVRRLQDYIPKPLLACIVLANIVFVATVVYFSQHPFEGFAGYANLLGLVMINAVFIFIIAVIYRGEKNQGYYHPQHREAIKKRAIQINMLILTICLFHISISIWVQGSELVEYKLFIQSFYLQFVLALSAFALTLPRSIFKELAD